MMMITQYFGALPVHTPARTERDVKLLLLRLYPLPSALILVSAQPASGADMLKDVGMHGRSNNSTIFLPHTPGAVADVAAEVRSIEHQHRGFYTL